RRADQRADADRDRAVLRRAAAAQGVRQDDPVHHPQAGGGDGDRRHGDGDAARAGEDHRAHRRHQPGEARPRDGRPRRHLPGAAHGARHRRHHARDRPRLRRQRPRAAGARRRLALGPGGRGVRHRRRRRQRAARTGGGDRRAAAGHGGNDPRRRGGHQHCLGVRAGARPRYRLRARGPPPRRAGAQPFGGPEHDAEKLQPAAVRALRLPRRRRHPPPRRDAGEGLRHQAPEHRPGDPVPVRRQPAEGDPRPRAGGLAPGRGGRAGDQGPRRRSHRVRPEADPGAARPRRRGALHLDRARAPDGHRRPDRGDVPRPADGGDAHRGGNLRIARVADGRGRGGVMAQVVRLLFALKSVWAVLAALVCGSFLIMLAGSDPIAAYTALFHGAFVDYWGFAATLVKTCPLLLAGLAVVLPLRAGLFNIGGEGQIYIGALFATIVALYVPELPGPIHIALASIAGAIGGALWALLPAILKAYQRINEIIVTLLMNFVALHFVSFVVSGPMMEEGAPYPYSPEIPLGLFLPHILPRTDA